MKEAIEKAKEKKEVEETKAAEAAGVPVKLHNYKVKFSYVDSEGKRLDHSSIVKDCQNMHDAKQTIFELIRAKGLDGEAVTFDQVTKATPQEVDEATPPEIAEVKPETVPMFEMEEKKDQAPDSERTATFVARIANVSVKNGTVRLLKISLECATNVPEVNYELLSKFRSNEDLYITAQPHQLTAKDVHPNKKFKDKIEEETAVPTVTEDYTCPFCICPMTITYPKGAKPKTITCDGCGNEFPIEFQDEPAVEPGAESGLFEDGKTETQEDRNDQIVA